MMDQRLLHNLEDQYRALPANRDRLVDVSVGVGAARVVLTPRADDRTPAQGLEPAFLTRALTDVARLVAASTNTDGYAAFERQNLLVEDDTDADEDVDRPLTARAQLVALREDRAVVQSILLDADGYPIARALTVFFTTEPEDEADDDTSEDEPWDDTRIPAYVWNTPFGPIYPN